MIFALGFSLEKVAAMQEHGIKGTPFYFLRETMKVSFIESFHQVYFKGTWVRLVFK
jgi:hypothetical protein